jgi:hypothetical protein
MRSLPSLQTELRRYAERALGERGGAPIDPRVVVQPFRTMGLVPRRHAAEVQAVLGRDARGWDYTITPYGVRHAWSRHGPGTRQAAQGQIDLTARDFANLPLVLDAPDRIEPAPAVAGQLPRVLYVRTIGDREYHVILEARSPKRKMLALVTMWAKRVSGGPPA